MPKTYILPIRETDKEIYDLIKNGKKKVETRGGGPRYANISDRDVVKIKCGKDSFLRRVKNVKKFKSVDEMLKIYDVLDIDPRISTAEELKKLYRSFPGQEERLVQIRHYCF